MTVGVLPRGTVTSETLSKAYRPSSPPCRSSSVTRVKQPALIDLLSILTVVSSEVCMCACPVRYPLPCLVSLAQTGEGRRMSACQYPAASLLLAFGAHGAVLSVCCTCQEEERSEAPSVSCYVDLKIDSILPSFLFPVQLCFHSQRPSPGSPSLFSSHSCPLPPCLSVWFK